MADHELTLALEIVDREGSPIAGATTQVIRNNSVLDCCSWPDRERHSDAAGLVDIPALSALPLPFGERTVVTITHPNFAEELVYRPEELPRDGAVVHLRVTLSTGGMLRGTVRGGPGAALVSTWKDADVPGCHDVVRQAQAADDGSFCLTGLRAGEHEIELSGSFVPTSITVVMPRDEPIEIETQPGVELTGTVLGEDGLPLAGATVEIGMHGGRQSSRVETGADGRFALAALPPDEAIELQARAPAVGEDEPVLLALMVIAPSATDGHVKLDARERRRLRGVIVNEATGHPFRGWTRVSARLRASSLLVFLPLGDDGRFDVLLPRGRYDIAFTAHGDLFTLGGIIGRDFVVEADQVDLVIRAHAAFDLAVSVRDAESGEPIRGAAAAGRVSGLLCEAFYGITNEAGIATLQAVIPGPMLLTVEAAGHQRWESEVLQIEVGQQPIEVSLVKRPVA